MTALTTLLLPPRRDHTLAMQQGELMVPAPQSSFDLAIVIDVLRATSVMVTALNAGAKSVTTCGTIKEARSLADRQQSEVVLCGERNCQKITGFDLGNSPNEYQEASVLGKHVILTTTNGTAAIEAMNEVSSLIIASFLNLSIVVERMATADSVCIVCAGTNGFVTAEDVLLAGALVWEMERLKGDTQLDDASMLASAFWCNRLSISPQQTHFPDPLTLSRCFEQTLGGRNLLRLGFGKDLDTCSHINSQPVIPVRVQAKPSEFRL